MTDIRKLQVFVSSTYVDLIEERQTAVSAILKAGHIPAGMELFSAGDKSQLDVIKRWIDQSDVYMLILGTRYGSIEPVSGDGYTEVEYDYAVSTGKPFFALVMGDTAIDSKLKETGSQFLEVKSPEKLKNFKNKVLGKICAIYNDPRDIKSYIYESLIDLASRPDLEGWVRGGIIIDPKPLYKQIADLTDENKKLKSDLSDARVRQEEVVVSTTDEANFIPLKNLLDSQKITIPAELSSTGLEIERTVFRLFVANISNFIRGVTVGNPMKPKTRFFDIHVYPVLVMHRLLATQTIGAQRVYTLTERGIDFAAWNDRRKLETAQSVAEK